MHKFMKLFPPFTSVAKNRSDLRRNVNVNEDEMSSIRAQTKLRAKSKRLDDF